MLDESFKEIVRNIKSEIKSVQVKIAVEANKSLISMYYRLGKILNDNYKYGNKFIDYVACELKLEFPNMTGFSVRNLKYMKKFYLEYMNDEKVQQLVAQLPWGHNIILMDKIKDINIRKVYIDETLKNGWGRDMLALQIKNNYHTRIGKSNNNFKNSLSQINSDLANYTIKDPYIFDFITLKEGYKEKEFEAALLNKIKNVLLEFGKGFSFVGSQYKVSTLKNDYYVDLLFYHLDLRCYIVVELKTQEFKPEFIGQLSFYVTAVDETLKRDFDNQTIGLLLCREKDRLSVEWSLKGTNIPIGISSYEIGKYIPRDILDKLPTEDDINLHIDLGDEL